MSLDHSLSAVKISDETRQKLLNISTDFYRLAGYMDTCDLQGILELLKVELEGRNRPSYISRIYGRYRKMLPQYDAEILARWNRGI